MDSSGKRNRSSNMTVGEKELLADLCLKYADVIECKSTDGLSKSAKVCRKLTNVYSSVTSVTKMTTQG